MEAERVPISTLLQGAQRPPPPAAPPSPELLETARRAGEENARLGLQSRIDALEAELEEATAQHARNLQAAQETASRLFAALEELLANELAGLAHAAARAVLAAEPAIAPDTLCALMADAIADLPRGTLHVPADMLEAARALCPDGWSAMPRAGLAPGTVEAVAGPALQRQSLENRLSGLLGAAQ